MLKLNYGKVKCFNELACEAAPMIKGKHHLAEPPTGHPMKKLYNFESGGIKCLGQFYDDTVLHQIACNLLF
jgi:hypothetical protein